MDHEIAQGTRFYVFNDQSWFGTLIGWIQSKTSVIKNRSQDDQK